MAEIKVFSHFDFDGLCNSNGWCDDNVETLTDKAFISICTTKDVCEHYLEEEDVHWFKRNHPNVINVDFDDVDFDINFGEEDGFIAKAMSEEQGKEIYDFVERNLGRDIYVHCKAGKSRSQGVFRAICAIWPTIYDEKENYNDSNPCLTPNMCVIRNIKRAAYQKLDIK